MNVQHGSSTPSTDVHQAQRRNACRPMSPDPSHLADGGRGILGVVRRVRDDATCGREVVEQAAGGAIWSMHWAQEAPGLGQQLAHGRGAQLRKVGSPMHRAEVRDEAASEAGGL